MIKEKSKKPSSWDSESAVDFPPGKPAILVGVFLAMEHNVKAI